MNRNLRQLILSVVTASPLMASADNADWLFEAKQMLRDNNASQAVSILEPKMVSHAGELEYDFLLGQAALANKQPNLAVFALERVVLTAPSQAGARYTLAQAYARLGEYTQARKELNYIIKTSSNSRYSQLSQKMLLGLRPQNKTLFQVFARAGLGNDSNANSATKQDTISGFLNSNEFTLDENSQATPSATAMGQLQAFVSRSLTESLTFKASADLLNQDYRSASFVNTTIATFNSGLSYLTSRSMRENIGFYVRHIEVDDTMNNQQFAGHFTHQQKFSKSSAINASFRVGRTSYAKPYAIKDVNQFSTGLQYQYKTRTKSKDTIGTTLAAIAGKDDTRQNNSPYGRTYAGGQAGIFLANGSGKVNVQANVFYIDSKYPNENRYIYERQDSTFGAGIKLNLNLHRKWQISPNLSYTNNDSPISLYEFERTQFNVVVSHQLI